MQSNWMALNKTRSTFVCFIHVLTYIFPFLVIFKLDVNASLFIIISHFVIDRFSLAKYLIWIKNLISLDTIEPFSLCSKTGYSINTTPEWLAVFLYIITDNTLHIICNGIAISYL